MAVWRSLDVKTVNLSDAAFPGFGAVAENRIEVGQCRFCVRAAGRVLGIRLPPGVEFHVRCRFVAVIGADRQRRIEDLV